MYCTKLAVNVTIHDNIQTCAFLDETVVSSMHIMVEEINEGESKTICCHTPTIWIKKRNKTILVEHNVNKSCYLNQHVNRYDEVNYTCIADKTVGSGSVTIVLKIRCKC